MCLPRQPFVERGARYPRSVSNPGQTVDSAAAATIGARTAAHNGKRLDFGRDMMNNPLPHNRFAMPGWGR
mgnify:CR=1 FL=1